MTATFSASIVRHHPLQTWHPATWADYVALRDEKKHLYAALGIPEYWVIDVQGRRVFAFALQDNGTYQPCDTCQALAGLPMAWLTEALERLAQGSNTHVATARYPGWLKTPLLHL